MTRRLISVSFHSDFRCNLNVQLRGHKFPIRNKSGVGIAAEESMALLIRLRGILLEIIIVSSQWHSTIIRSTSMRECQCLSSGEIK